MDIAELRDVQSRERTTDSLQELPDSFYSDVASYIAELKAERERTAEAADDPFADPDVSRLSDEIQTAEQVAESLYERRVGKIVKQASFAAAGMGGAEDGLTAEEQDLYDDLVERIEDNKTRVLDVLAGEGDAAPGDGSDVDAAPQPASEDSGVDASALMGDGADLDSETPAPPTDDAASAPDAGSHPPGDSADGATPETATAEGSDGAERADSREKPAPPSESDADTGSSLADERATVRITSDVGEIFGVDERTYTLESEDVVSLPEANAEPLVDKDAATRLD